MASACLPQMPESVTYVIGMTCNLCAEKHSEDRLTAYTTLVQEGSRSHSGILTRPTLPIVSFEIRPELNPERSRSFSKSSDSSGTAQSRGSIGRPSILIRLSTFENQALTGFDSAALAEVACGDDHGFFVLRDSSLEAHDLVTARFDGRDDCVVASNLYSD